MAVVKPIYYNSGNIQEMSDAQITQLKDFCTLKFYTSNAVTLAVSVNGGNIGSISDTRLQAGASSTSTTAFPSEATTAEPSTVTVNFNHINQTVNTSATLTADSGTLYPAYIDGSNNVRAMNLQDMKDTLIHPTFDIIFSTSDTTAQAGTYFISTSSSAAANTEVVSATPIYSDTRADTSAYTSGGIGEALDQPTTITNYYLHKNLQASVTKTNPLKIDGSNNLQEYPESDFDTMIENLMLFTAANSPDNYTLRYALGTSTANYSKGSGIADTRLNGSGNYQTRFVNTDDYRAQEFPDGTATTVNTYYLRLIKA